MAGRAFHLGWGTLVSRLLGLARDMLLAAFLGTGAVADSFLLAFRLANMVRRLLAEGSLSQAFVPAYTGLRRTEGRTRADCFARSCLLLLPLLCAGLAGIGILCAKPLALLLGPGLLQKGELEQTAFFLAACMPYLPLAAGAAVSSGILLARGSFLAPALNPALLNIFLIGGAGGALWFGPGSGALLLCAALVLGGAVQWLAQLPALRRLGFAAVGPCSLHDPAALAAVKKTPVAAFSAANQQIFMLGCLFWASFLGEGSIAMIYFAERLLDFPLGIIGSSLGLAALTGLAEETGNRQAFRTCLGLSLRLGCFLAAPASLGLFFLAAPLVSFFFGYGAFSEVSLEETTAILAAMAPALPALVLARPLVSALHALGKSREAFALTLKSLLLLLTAGAAAKALAPGSTGALLGAFSLGCWAFFGHLWRTLDRLDLLERPGWLFFRPMLAGNLVLAALLLGLDYLGAACSGAGTALMALAAPPAGAALYLAVTRACGSNEAAVVLALLRGRRAGIL